MNFSVSFFAGILTKYLTGRLNSKGICAQSTSYKISLEKKSVDRVYGGLRVALVVKT